MSHILKEQPVPFCISYYELRSLLHWAAVGISKSRGGSYNDAEGEEGLVGRIAWRIGFQLPTPPLFKQATKVKG